MDIGENSFTSWINHTPPPYDCANRSSKWRSEWFLEPIGMAAFYRPIRCTSKVSTSLEPCSVSGLCHGRFSYLDICYLGRIFNPP
jgi:hypothetical protein